VISQNAIGVSQIAISLEGIARWSSVSIPSELKELREPIPFFILMPLHIDAAALHARAMLRADPRLFAHVQVSNV
jgi:hypothetical protein